MRAVRSHAEQCLFAVPVRYVRCGQVFGDNLRGICGRHSRRRGGGRADICGQIAVVRGWWSPARTRIVSALMCVCVCVRTSSGGRACLCGCLCTHWRAYYGRPTRFRARIARRIVGIISTRIAHYTTKTKKTKQAVVAPNEHTQFDLSLMMLSNYYYGLSVRM